MKDPDEIIDLWNSNASPWVDAVRQGRIESRRVATDAAVVQAVLEAKPGRVLDVGCGEGWLSRRLAQEGITVLGVDAVQSLVDSALAEPRPPQLAFETARIDDLAEARFSGFDLWVCNFSLFHPDDAVALVTAAAAHLQPGGHLVIQTLHANASSTKTDGWQPGNWGPCGTAFAEPIPWYFRTLESWLSLLWKHGFKGARVAEPKHPESGAALSYVIRAQASRSATRE